MATRQPLDVGRELLHAFEHSTRVSEHLVSVLPPQLWHAESPNKRRDIAAIVAHMQSLRRTFAKLGGARPVAPPLKAASSTPLEACRALQQSREALTKLFEGALARGEGRIKGLPRRTVNMMLYLVQHEAHHRGQICGLARDLGHRLSSDDVMRIWGWKKL
ncbi:MAG: hypothetical protein GEV06_05645 [Luteitalea sp.]|nr:hypothetical protein [Luteitalea sp.]